MALGPNPNHSLGFQASILRRLTPKPLDRDPLSTLQDSNSHAVGNCAVWSFAKPSEGEKQTRYKARFPAPPDAYLNSDLGEPISVPADQA